MLRVAGLALALALALAGCGGKDAVPAGLPTDEQGDPLPTVEGFVVDEAIRPMAGVRVLILQEGVEAVTDESGHYAIDRPTFAAEHVILSAVAAGYVPQSHMVQASGQTSARVDFRLTPDQHQIPHVEVLQHRGMLTCQVRAAGQGQFCDPPSFSFNEGVEVPELRSLWVMDTTIDLAGAVVQVHWDAESPLAEQLTVRLRGPVVGCCENQSLRYDDPVLDEATGASPVRLEVDEAAARAFPSWSALWLEVDVPESQGPVPAAFAREQSFDAYATLFYVDPAPAGYQLS